MKFACNCLNFIVEVEKSLNIIQCETKLSERTHPYFQENVLQLTGNVNCKYQTYTSLIKSHVFGSWNIYQCLSCQTFTNATNYVTGLETCSSKLKEVLDVKLFGKEEERTYSKVFKICIPTVLCIPENFNFPLPGSEILDQQSFDFIERKSSEFFKMADIKYQSSSEEEKVCFEDVQRRVLCEKKYILELLIKAKNETIQQDTQSSPMNTQFSCIENKDSSSSLMHDLTDEFQESLGNLSLNSSKRAYSKDKEDYVEGMFLMDEDDMEAKGCREPSDKDDSSDEENLGREYKDPPKEFLARSVPLDIPTMPLSFAQRNDSSEGKVPLEPQAMAASMKEISRNMRLSSVDVFGELPRRPKEDHF